MEETQVSEERLRPPVWIGHVVLETARFEESAEFLRKIGMRTVHPGPDVAVFELRGGTHLILMAKDEVIARDAPFDLMVEDLHETHRKFQSLGFGPTRIEAVPKIDHELFCVREPGGHRITFYSNHVSGRPV
jgi:catechol 2,3-dioxygenase-like lactoylglutathione lyase family enzyme